MIVHAHLPLLMATFLQWPPFRQKVCTFFWLVVTLSVGIIGLHKNCWAESATLPLPLKQPLFLPLPPPLSLPLPLSLSISFCSPSIHPSIDASIHKMLSKKLQHLQNLSIHLSVRPSIHPSIHLSPKCITSVHWVIWEKVVNNCIS